MVRQRRGVQWQFAIVDTSGYLLLTGPLAAPTTIGCPAGHIQVRDRTCGAGLCERSAHRSELDHTPTTPVAGPWSPTRGRLLSAPPGQGRAGR
ncbi:hypothetical protein DMH04_13810 [Kibdelosporangium aridum]|uniref:Uncharacterized protein n=1 Tax=Kibdelosporangium aridum TaxID=2030 RepID=A0A428ZDT8_KIBAR|nr:hypothetical protein DMH04_13810 [Kibdelosporangium aridum]